MLVSGGVAGSMGDFSFLSFLFVACLLALLCSDSLL